MVLLVSLPIGGRTDPSVFQNSPQPQVKDVSLKHIALQMDFPELCSCSARFCISCLPYNGAGRRSRGECRRDWNDDWVRLDSSTFLYQRGLKEKAMVALRLVRKRQFSSARPTQYSSLAPSTCCCTPSRYTSSLEKNASALNSGVRMLPLVLAGGLFATISRIFLGIFRYYMPLLTLAGVLSTLARD